MFFGKKENKAELPDLPPLPPLPRKDQQVVSNAGGVPEFPESPGESSFGMMQLPGRKDAFLNQPMEEKKVKVVEMEEWHPHGSEPEESDEEYEMELPEVPHLPRISESESEMTRRPMGQLPMSRRMYVQHKTIQPQQVDDVFVRIDKFHTARKSLSEIQNKLNDIDELVRRIRDTKLKEEQELANWEKELMQIKSKVQTVTENIFEKVE
ncbi:hypothetical protein J4233_01230 [Candidatus Pacearchaeota archaeon]|nr:hypothetical protein [Candidatus Pacearchaeota archaeon]